MKGGDWSATMAPPIRGTPEPKTNQPPTLDSHSPPREGTYVDSHDVQRRGRHQRGRRSEEPHHHGRSRFKVAPRARLNLRLIIAAVEVRSVPPEGRRKYRGQEHGWVRAHRPSRPGRAREAPGQHRVPAPARHHPPGALDRVRAVMHRGNEGGGDPVLPRHAEERDEARGEGTPQAGLGGARC